MRSRIVFIGLCLVLGLLSAALRFYHLDAAPFHGDELYTFQETDSLFSQEHHPKGQIARLPRIVPLSHLAHHAGYQLFGRSEWGSRALMAILGCLTVLVVFVGLDKPIGRSSALMTALLLAVWPEHLYYSQLNRFYMVTCFLVSSSMIVGAIGIHRRSSLLIFLSALLGLAAIFSHTVSFVALAALFPAVLLAARGVVGFPLFRSLAWIVSVSLIALAALGFYLFPLLREWNNDVTWSYSPLHSLAASVFRLGWPVALLIGFGATLSLVRRDEQDRYWLVWSMLWGVCCLGLPLVIPHRPVYCLPLTLGLFVLAGRGAGCLFEMITARGPLLALAWVVVIACLNLPSLMSHYVDGSTSDYRTAARYVSERAKDDDIVLAHSQDLFRHYSNKPLEAKSIDLYDPQRGLSQLTKQSQGTNRFWVVINYGRASRPHELLKWLAAHCSHELHLCKLRYDYATLTTDVFLFARQYSTSLKP